MRFADRAGLFVLIAAALSCNAFDGPSSCPDGECFGRDMPTFPKDATEHMQKTDDVNHPGLNAGTHKLWKFIR